MMVIQISMETALQDNEEKDLGLDNIYTLAQKAKLNNRKRANSQIKGNSFAQQKVELSETPFLFFPAGLEKVFLAIYFISLPYITGLLFLFFYVADGKIELFSSLNQDSSFILTWAIGYEILAVLALLYLVKSAISFSRDIALNGRNETFIIP